jgi:C4-dicarboxylate transporter DctM subunit
MIWLAVAVGAAGLIISVPIFLVFGLSGGLVTAGALNLPWDLITQVTFDAITKYILLAIPLFIFSSLVMVEGGMAHRLVAVFTSAVGHWRGGLAVAMVLAMGFFGALCGSILAAIVAVGGIMIPPMVKQGYPRPFVAALAACSGFLDTLIPPSNSAIIYCAITGESVPKAFAAGIIPGFVFGALLLAVVFWKCRHMGRSRFAGWGEVGRAAQAALPALITPVIILGGSYSNLFTPTESAALAGVWAVFVGFVIYRELTWAKLWQALKNTAVTTSVIFAIIATASFLSVALTYTRFPHRVIEAVLGWGATPFLFFLAIALIVLILGCFIEVVPIMYLTVPIFAPLAAALHVDLLQLMTVLTAFVGLGLLTPPVCVGAYTAAAIAQEEAASVIRAVFPTFFLQGIVYGLILMLFPGLSTWLPSLV